MTFDEHLWRDVWERNLNAVERHSIAMTVWRRRRPSNHFEALVALELARRWRRHTVFLATVYGLWTLFWGALAWHDLRLHDTFETLLSPTCAAIGVAAIAACMAFNWRMRGYLRVHAVLVH